MTDAGLLGAIIAGGALVAALLWHAGGRPRPAGGADPEAGDDLLGLDEAGPSDLGADWIDDGPSELAGFNLQRVRDTWPIELEGFTVRAGERLHLQLMRTDTGTRVLARAQQGFVTLRAEDVPVAFRVPWRRPNGEQPAARLVRALWSGLSVHLDQRLESALPHAPDLEPAATYRAAVNLVAGVRGLASAEADLVAWLAAPPPALPPRGVPARLDRALRAEHLLRYFDAAEAHRAVVRAVATAERAAPEAPLRARALLVLDAGEPLLELALAEKLPADLGRAALRAGLRWALAQGDEAAIDRALGHPEVVQAEADWLADAVARAPALPGPGGAADVREAWSPEALQRRVFLQLIDRARDLGSLYATFADTPPDDPIHLIALSALDPAVARAAGERLRAAVGPAALAERTLRALAEGARTGSNAAPVAARSGPVARTLRRIGPHCGAEHLAALGSWARAQTPAGEPDHPVQEAAQAELEALRRRLPPELAGGLALAAGEAGALSPAESTTTETTPDP